MQDGLSLPTSTIKTSRGTIINGKEWLKQASMYTRIRSCFLGGACLYSAEGMVEACSILPCGDGVKAFRDELDVLRNQDEKIEALYPSGIEIPFHRGE